MANAASLVSTNDVTKAKLELDRMRRSLKSWLKYRQLNDAVVDGAAPTKKPRKYAATVIAQARDWEGEGRLAKQLYVLLTESFPNATIPEPNLSVNPQAAVELARIAISGPASARSPEAQGAWYLAWPVLIVGGLLLAVTTAIRSTADVVKEKERLACVQAGACTDSGFWLKWGGIAALVYVAWRMGAGERIKGVLKGKG
jgi:hypothetical protein